MALKTWQKVILVISTLCILFTSLNLGVFAEELPEEDEEILIDPVEIDNWFSSSNYVWEDENGIIRPLAGISLYNTAADATYYLTEELAALGVGAMTAGGLAVAILIAGYATAEGIEYIIEEGPTAYAYLCELIRRGCSYDTQQALTDMIASGAEVFSLAESVLADVQAQIDYYFQEFVKTGQYVLHLGDTYLNTSTFTSYPASTSRDYVLYDAGCKYLSKGTSSDAVYGSWSEWVIADYTNFKWRVTKANNSSGSNSYNTYEFVNLITGASVIMSSSVGSYWVAKNRLVPFSYNHIVGDKVVTQFGLGIANYFYATGKYGSYVGDLDRWASADWPLTVRGSGTVLDGLSIIAVAFNSVTGLFDYTDADGNVISLTFDPFAIVFGNIGTGGIAGTTTTLPDSLTDVVVPPLVFPNEDDETVVVPQEGVIEAGKDIANSDTAVDTDTPSTGGESGGDILGFFDSIFGEGSNILSLFGWLPDSFQFMAKTSFDVIVAFFVILVALKLLPG